MAARWRAVVSGDDRVIELADWVLKAEWVLKVERVRGHGRIRAAGGTWPAGGIRVAAWFLVTGPPRALGLTRER